MSNLIQLKKEQELLHRINWDWNFDREMGRMKKETEKNISESNFELGEIVVFLGGTYRDEVWISRLRKIHFELPFLAPRYRKATIKEKETFFNSGEHEFIIE